VAIGAGSILTVSSSSGESGAMAGSTYILGPSRALLSAGLYKRADQYFHKGVPASKKEAFHGFFQKWKERLNPIEHLHAEATEILEVMPWLRLASQSDPHNIEIFLVAAHWLNGEGQSPDLALGVLEEALEKNPYRYEIYLEKGRLYLSNGNLDAASKAFQTTLTVLRQKPQDDLEQARIDTGLVLLVRSYIYEAQNDQEAALNAVTERLKMDPDHQNLIARMQQLKSGQLDPEAAISRLNELFSNSYVCSEEPHSNSSGCACSSCETEEHIHDENCNHEQEHVHGSHCNHD
jgi:tetratricopeptide (TPR) repeat protein